MKKILIYISWTNNNAWLW